MVACFNFDEGEIFIYRTKLGVAITGAVPRTAAYNVKPPPDDSNNVTLFKRVSCEGNGLKSILE